MAEPPNPARGAVALLSEKEASGKVQPSSREPPGSMSAKKVRTEEKKAPRRVNGEGGSGGNGGQLQPQSFGSPAAWSFAARPAASSSSTSRSCYSFSASPSVSSASASSSQPLPRKLLVTPSLLHAQPHRVLLPPVAPPAAAKPRRPKEKREKEKRRQHGLGAAARDENGEAKPLPRDKIKDKIKEKDKEREKKKHKVMSEIKKENGDVKILLKSKKNIFSWYLQSWPDATDQLGGSS